jgi:hypothetical protein
MAHLCHRPRRILGVVGYKLSVWIHSRPVRVLPDPTRENAIK